MFGTTLFPTLSTWPNEQVTAELVRFIVEHPDSLGLAPGLEPAHLGLSPRRELRSDAGALTLLRFDQTYRGFPVFGPDAVVKVVAKRDGALGLRGAIIDGRAEFEHAGGPSSATSAAASVRFHVAQQTGLAPAELELNDLRLVAVPRARAIGWAASVEHGGWHVATAVVAASRPASGAHAKLLYFDDDRQAGLADEVAVEVLAEDRGSDVLEDPVTASLATVWADGAPLHGSMLDQHVALADERVVAYNAIAATKGTALRLVPPFSTPDASFNALPGTREFRVQDAYVSARNFYAWTDRFMAGRWDSHLGAASPFAPGQYSPRLLVYENVGFQFCGEQSFCAGVLPSSAIIEDLANEYEQPLGGPVFEAIGYFAVEDTAGISANTLAHEFGHFIDNFADPGSISAGFGCQNCPPSCVPDTTDESAPLVESFASFTALWLLRDLYAVGQSPTSCAVTQAVSHGGSDSPHVEGCTDGGSDIALFLPTGAPECAGFTCDALDAGDTTATTGICNRSPGYRIDSFFQALWEAMLAHTCDVSAPHSCVSRPALVSEPAGDIVGGALLYALRVNTATYRGFADDMATYVACNHGEPTYQAFNEILCHHKIRACDAPTPALCETCGNRIREGQEACDGTDLGGQTCEKLGFEGGSLMCDVNCNLDDSLCMNGIPTTGAGTAEPTSDGLTETGIVLDSDATAGGVADDGCGCRSTSSASWLMALLGGALFRRRRQTALGLVAVGSLIAAQAGCGPEMPMSEGTQSGTSGSSTGPAMSTGDAPGEVSARMFGKFHYAVTDAGVTVSEPPGGSWFFFPWSTLQVERDGWVTVRPKTCEDQHDVQKFSWVHVGDDALQVVPDEYKSNGTFRWKADDVVAVTLTPGPGCDDLHEVIEYLPDSGPPGNTNLHLPGDICTEDDTPGNPEDCNFTFVWCAEGAPPACTADAP